jgi:hypothetical protein
LGRNTYKNNIIILMFWNYWLYNMLYKPLVAP